MNVATIYLREKATDAVAAGIERGNVPSGKVVLFVHGGTVPSVPDYDLDYKDYSWATRHATPRRSTS